MSIVYQNGEFYLKGPYVIKQRELIKWGRRETKDFVSQIYKMDNMFSTKFSSKAWTLWIVFLYQVCVYIGASKEGMTCSISREPLKIW